MRVCVPTTDVSVSQIYIKSTFSHPTVTKTVGQALTLETNKQPQQNQLPYGFDQQDKSYLICFTSTLTSTHGKRITLFTKELAKTKAKGYSRSVIQDFGCD